jgi:hypothetical protein
VRGSPTRDGIVKILRDKDIDRRLAELNRRLASSDAPEAAVDELLGEMHRLRQLKKAGAGREEATSERRIASGRRKHGIVPLRKTHFPLRRPDRAEVLRQGGWVGVVGISEKRRLKELNLAGPNPLVYRTKANCLRICLSGPIAVVYPGGGLVSLLHTGRFGANHPGAFDRRPSGRGLRAGAKRLPVKALAAD